MSLSLRSLIVHSSLSLLVFIWRCIPPVAKVVMGADATTIIDTPLGASRDDADHGGRYLVVPLRPHP